MQGKRKRNSKSKKSDKRNNIFQSSEKKPKTAYKEMKHMGKNKSHELKKKLGKALQQNRRVPLFAMAKTARRVTRNVKSRHWKNKKLKIKVD